MLPAASMKARTNGEKQKHSSLTGDLLIGRVVTQVLV